MLILFVVVFDEKIRLKIEEEKLLHEIIQRVLMNGRYMNAVFFLFIQCYIIIIIFTSLCVAMAGPSNMINETSYQFV